MVKQRLQTPCPADPVLCNTVLGQQSGLWITALCTSLPCVRPACPVHPGWAATQ